MRKSRLQHLSHPRIGPLIDTPLYRDTKDPCPLFDGKEWHLYGSGGSTKNERWEILHATAEAPEGPWKCRDEARLEGVAGKGVAAPSVIYDAEDKVFHMFVQTHFMELGSSVEHLVSEDGTSFSYVNRAIGPIPLSPEAGIYDPHVAIIKGEKYLSYSGFAHVSKPDVFLAKSLHNTWNGPWVRIGRIMSHHEISHHNQLDNPDYEWGLEGSQLIELPSGLILMNAVCFLPDGVRGTRQRVFFSVGYKQEGPYSTLGPVLDPLRNEWESGENGHAAGIVHDNELLLFYQARSSDEGKNTWKYGLVKYSVDLLDQVGRAVLKMHEERNAIEPWMADIKEIS